MDDYKRLESPRAMKRVEAYEVNGTLYRSKDEAEVADWAGRYYDYQYKSGKYALVMGDVASLIIKWLMSVGWKAP